MSKVILITGTSTGLGVSIAVQAARAGHTVYATMRNIGKRGTLDAAAAKAGVTLNVLTLDVQDTASVNTAIDTVIAAQGRLIFSGLPEISLKQGEVSRRNRTTLVSA